MPQKLSMARGRRFFGLLIAISCTLAFFGSLGSWHYRSQDRVLFLVFAVLGLVLWLSGRRRKKITKLYPGYAKRLMAEPDCTMESLASSMGISPAAAREGLLYLYRRHCFPGAYEDKGRACIVFTGNPNLLLSLDPGRQKELDLQAGTARQAAPAAAVPYNGSAQPQVPSQATVSCPGCGAINHLPAGTAGQCEYCGVSIQG